MFTNEIKVNENSKVIESATIGINTDKGFSGLRVVQKDGNKVEEYLMQNQVFKTKPVGMMNDQDITEVQEKLDNIEYGLFEQIREAKVNFTLTKFSSGLKNAVMYYDALNDAIDANLEFISDDLPCPSNNLDYFRGDDIV
ncbi:MAG: hypothetical protein COB67_00065 [SAR324 cluster bacterium]|uniref:Uncharacterized protein n=1 Tax=SAR324 cluster bacterium TaxID=2024889 RepID=A0A2A4TBH8_9DELT|nr:MAG: hypothetical protein COB67_00065 [SAR324 cluster bacterium]